MSLTSVLCECACKDGQDPGGGPALGLDQRFDAVVPRPAGRPRERGLTSYSADVDIPLMEPPIRDGAVWHLRPEEGNTFQRARLLLHPNGMSVRYPNGSGTGAEVSALAVSWSPFSLVQACRLHSIQADAQQPWLRLFKISVFHHGVTHFFATQGSDADTERARWVADVSRALRGLTQSLFPSFSLTSEPLAGAGWTAMRLLAGYLLLCDDRGVSLIYCELHAHWDGAAAFAAYEDEYCDVQVIRLSVDKDTCVSERVGIDCSCFSLGGHHFNSRSCSEKMLWLRAISNVKVKLRHRALNPTPTDLKHYRAAVLEYVANLTDNPQALQTTAYKPLLPHRGWRRSLLPPPSGSTVPLDGGNPTAPIGTNRSSGGAFGPCTLPGASAKPPEPDVSPASHTMQDPCGTNPSSSRNASEVPPEPGVPSPGSSSRSAGVVTTPPLAPAAAVEVNAPCPLLEHNSPRRAEVAGEADAAAGTDVKTELVEGGIDVGVPALGRNASSPVGSSFPTPPEKSLTPVTHVTASGPPS